MARRVKFKARGLKADLDDVMALTLNQRRHDADGNRIQGYSFDAILAMTPAERERLKQVGWLATKSTTNTRRR
jgi:hypothetical protein